MPLRGSYSAILRRVEEAEQRATTLRAAGPGCPTCGAWAYPHVVVYPDPPQFAEARDTPWYCRPWARPHGDACPGCRECHPRGGWPPALRCPGCGREPATVIRVVYADQDDAFWGGRAPAPTTMPVEAPPATEADPAPAAAAAPDLEGLAGVEWSPAARRLLGLP